MRCALNIHLFIDAVKIWLNDNKNDDKNDDKNVN